MKQSFETVKERTLTSEESVTQRFSLLAKNLGNMQGVLSPDEYERTGHGGEIKVDIDSKHKELMLVKTDTGAVVSAERELVTERLSGCVALFINGPGVNGLIHLTPSTDLGYYYYRYSNPAELVKKKVEKILESLSQVVNPKDCRGLMIVNEGNDSGGPYDKDNISQAWVRLKNQLLEAGLGDVIIADPLPLDETTIYYNPQEPDTLSVAGIMVDADSTKKQTRQVSLSIQDGKVLTKE